MRLVALLALIVATLGLVAGVKAQEATPSSIAARPNDTMTYADGNALFLLPLQNSEDVSIVAVGVFTVRAGQIFIPVVVRNDSQVAVRDVKVAAAVRAEAGSLYAAGESISLAPLTLPSGEVAIGELRFDVSHMPLGAELSSSISFDIASGPDEPRDYNLLVSESNHVENRIVGLVSNVGTQDAPDATVSVLCFSGTIISGLVRSSVPEITMRATVPFQVTVDISCENYFVAVR